MKPADKSRIDVLLSWGQENGVVLHELVEVYQDEVTKFSLKLKDSAPASLPSGFVAATCPASATLSYLNAVTGGQLPVDVSGHFESHPSFPQEFISSLPPHVIGRFFLVQQYLMGKDSFWWPYIQTLPQPEHLSSWGLPAFWPDEDIEFLEGTNAHTAIQEIQGHLKREFKQARKVLKDCNLPDWQDYTRLLYNWAFCVFTSRSFCPSTVLSEHLQKKISNILPENCSIDDFSVLMPIMDIANHSTTASVQWDVTSDPKTCQLLIFDAYLPGQQIFNHYGQKTNAELLLGYGFVIPETPELHNDYVHLRKRLGETEVGRTDGGNSIKPAEFLISLRPILDESSHVGKSRQRVDSITDEFRRVHGLTHVEDSLIWDLAVAVRNAADERPGSTVVDEDISLIFASATAPASSELITRMKNHLLDKLDYDYNLLKEGEVGEDGRSRFVPVNANQELAGYYRTQYGNVLERVLSVLNQAVS